MTDPEGEAVQTFTDRRYTSIKIVTGIVKVLTVYHVSLNTKNITDAGHKKKKRDAPQSA